MEFRVNQPGPPSKMKLSSWHGLWCLDFFNKSKGSGLAFASKLIDWRKMWCPVSGSRALNITRYTLLITDFQVLCFLLYLHEYICTCKVLRPKCHISWRVLHGTLHQKCSQILKTQIEFKNAVLEIHPKARWLCLSRMQSDECEEYSWSCAGLSIRAGLICPFTWGLLSGYCKAKLKENMQV